MIQNHIKNGSTNQTIALDITAINKRLTTIRNKVKMLDFLLTC